MSQLHLRVESATNNMRLDFVFADIEPISSAAVQADTLEMVQQVRGHSNSQINQAYVGNYQCYPGANDESITYPTATNRSVWDTFYRSSGLNVAMPSAYQWAGFATHADAELWRTDHGGGVYTYERVAPNVQSALFWGSLERVSTPARAIHDDPALAGHKLIPWVSGYIPDTSLDPIPLSHEDQTRLIQHYRLRDVDGYYYYRSLDVSWYDPAIPSDYAGNENAKSAYLAGWQELDWLFDGVNENDIEIMNLAADKPGGFQWSAAETTNGAAVLLSNLGNFSKYFEFSELIAGGMSQQSVDELGGAGVSIAVGDHLLLTTQELPVPPAVHYTFKETAPGTWEVLVEVAGDDTAGLSAYEIWVDGVAPGTVTFAENVLGSTTEGFLSGTLVQGNIEGNFNAGNYQGSDNAIESIGMVTVNEAGVVLDAQALLGILSTEAGLTEENFRAIVAGLLNEAGDGFLDIITPTFEVISFAQLLGDANNDGVVSAGDYAAVQANFGNTGPAGGGLLGDASGDGVVSAGDYASVQANFGNVAATTGAVPEPATCALLSLSGAVMLLRRRR